MPSGMYLLIVSPITFFRVVLVSLSFRFDLRMKLLKMPSVAATSSLIVSKALFLSGGGVSAEPMATINPLMVLSSSNGAEITKEDPFWAALSIRGERGGL